MTTWIIYPLCTRVLAMIVQAHLTMSSWKIDMTFPRSSELKSMTKCPNCLLESVFILHFIYYHVAVGSNDHTSTDSIYQCYYFVHLFRTTYGSSSKVRLYEDCTCPLRQSSIKLYATAMQFIVKFSFTSSPMPSKCPICAWIYAIKTGYLWWFWKVFVPPFCN